MSIVGVLFYIGMGLFAICGVAVFVTIFEALRLSILVHAEDPALYKAVYVPLSWRSWDDVRIHWQFWKVDDQYSKIKKRIRTLVVFVVGMMLVMSLYFMVVAFVAFITGEWQK